MDMDAISVASESLSYLSIWIFHAIYLNGGGPLFVLVSFVLLSSHWGDLIGILGVGYDYGGPLIIRLGSCSIYSTYMTCAERFCYFWLQV